LEDKMAEQPQIVTGLGKAELHRILVRGYDLNKELVGKISFTDMTSLILRGRLPTGNEARMLDALLVILVEHGMVSHVIAARLIYHCAPEAMQAAVAAALCGAGSVHLGSSEWSAKMLIEALPRDAQNADLAAIAGSIYDDYSKRKQRMPGIGHRTHAEGDPRADTLFGIAQRDRCVWKILRPAPVIIENSDGTTQTTYPRQCHWSDWRYRPRHGLSLADYQSFRLNRPNTRSDRSHCRRNTEPDGDPDRRCGEASNRL
jgi:hypothetical protein